MTRQRIITLAVTVYLLFLVLNAPASLIRLFLPHSVQLSGLSGSLWSGRAETVYFQQRPLDEIRWSLPLWSLFTSCIGVQLEQQQGPNHLAGRVGVSWSGKQCISGLEGDYDLRKLQLLANRPVPELSGRWQLDHVGLWFDEGLPVNARGTIHWQQAALSLGSRLPLGDYRLQLADAEAGGIAVLAEETSGRLEGEVSILLNPDRSVVIQGRLQTSNPDDSIRNQLRLIGQMDSQGVFHIKKKFLLR